MIISVFDSVENIVGKGEIACTSNFSFSDNVFKRLLSQTHQKVSLCVKGLKRPRLKRLLKTFIVRVVENDGNQQCSRKYEIIAFQTVAPPGWLSGCEFNPRLRRLFFAAYFRLSALQKHVRKVVDGFGKKSCVSTGVRKPGNTYASPTAMI